MATFIPADSTQPLRDVTPDNGCDFQGAQLHALLSCDTIEVLPLPQGLIMILDEEGKLTGKLRNERATQLAGFVSPKQLIARMLRERDTGIDVIWVGEKITDDMTEVDYIVGDVLVCADEELR